MQLALGDVDDDENGINTPEEYAKDALRDTTEVAKADVLLAVMLDDKYAYRGTWTEIGTAIGLGKRIILVCTGLNEEKRISDERYEYPYQCMTNVFFWHQVIDYILCSMSI